jgi:hypothetical protein
LSSTSSLRVLLTGGDSLPEDDSAWAGLQPSGPVRVVLVSGNADPGITDPGTASIPGSPPLQQALLAIPGVELEVIPPQDYLDQAADLTVFHGFLPQTLPSGQVLVVDPPEKGESAPSGGLHAASSGLRDVPPAAPLQFPSPGLSLSDVDFSGVRWSQAWELEEIPAGFRTLLQAGDVPLLLQGDVGQSRVWVLLADLSSGNFTRHPAFPIFIVNQVQARSARCRPASTPAKRWSYRFWGGPGPEGHPPDAGSPEEMQAGPEAAWEQTLEPGLYRFIMEWRGRGPVEYVLGANAGRLLNRISGA